MKTSVALYLYETFNSLSRSRKYWNLLLFAFVILAVVFDVGLTQGAYFLFGLFAWFCLVFFQFSIILVVLRRLQLSLRLMIDFVCLGLPPLAFHLLFDFGSRLILFAFFVALILFPMARANYPRA